MTRPLRPYYRLHPDFVEAVRAAHRTDWPAIHSAADLRRAPWYRFDYILAGSDSCNPIAPADSAQSRRLQRLADAIHYSGPILGEISECSR